MKNIFAGGLILAVLFGLLMVNSVYFEMNISIIKNDIFCYSACENAEEAGEALFRAYERWDEMKYYSSVMLRQTEADAVSDAFCELISAFDAEGKCSRGGAVKLINHLNAIADMESLSFVSIL